MRRAKAAREGRRGACCHPSTREGSALIEGLSRGVVPGLPLPPHPNIASRAADGAQPSIMQDICTPGLYRATPLSPALPCPAPKGPASPRVPPLLTPPRPASPSPSPASPQPPRHDTNWNPNCAEERIGLTLAPPTLSRPAATPTAAAGKEGRSWRLTHLGCSTRENVRPTPGPW